jgi:hypothetical protein
MAYFIRKRTSFFHCGHEHKKMLEDITFWSYNKTKSNYFNTVEHHLMTAALLVIHSMRGFLDKSLTTMLSYNAFISFHFMQYIGVPS